MQKWKLLIDYSKMLHEVAMVPIKQLGELHAPLIINLFYIEVIRQMCNPGEEIKLLLF